MGWLPQSPGSSSKLEPINLYQMTNQIKKRVSLEGMCPGHIDGGNLTFVVFVIFLSQWFLEVLEIKGPW